MVTIVDPHLKKDDNYKVYSDAKSKDLLVKNKDGNDYDGWCWPGMCIRSQEFTIPAGMVLGWSPFKIVSVSPSLHSRWLLLLRIEFVFKCP